MNHVLYSMVIPFPFTILSALLLISLIYWKREPFYLAAILFVYGLLSNLFIKKTIGYFFQASHPNLVNRPTTCPGAKLNNDGQVIMCENCSLIPMWDQSRIAPNVMLGMPSGHAQFMVLMATLWTYHAIQYLNNNKLHQIASITIFWLLAIVVCYQRIHSQCHTLLQVVLGASVGLFFGVVILKNKMFKLKF